MQQFIQKLKKKSFYGARIGPDTFKKIVTHAKYNQDLLQKFSLTPSGHEELDQLFVSSLQSSCANTCEHLAKWDFLFVICLPVHAWVFSKKDIKKFPNHT